MVKLAAANAIAYFVGEGFITALLKSFDLRRRWLEWMARYKELRNSRWT